MITLDSIRKDFMTLWHMLGLTTSKHDQLERALSGLVFEIVRYQTQDETSDNDKEEAWTLLDTMRIQYDAVMGYRAAEDIMNIIKNHTQ